MDSREQYMRRCIELAMMGSGHVSPNPMVGAVVVCDGRIIGEGYHRRCGGPHAEVNAINSVADTSLLPRSEIYVSLEPCAHFGKTPPCADLIISKGIRKCYVGCLDPFGKVDGKGIQKLRAAGVEVEVGILEDECRELNRRFFTSVSLGRPYVILKWAQSADGFIDKDFEPARISNHYTEILNHKWRSEEDAIMVGANTAMRDNPSLTCRLWPGRNPLRVVIDPGLRLAKSLRLFDQSARTAVICRKGAEPACGGGNVSYHGVDFGAESPAGILAALFDIGVRSLIVEGGAYTHRMFAESGLWDEARVLVSPASMGSGTRAICLPPQAMASREDAQGNWLMYYRNRDYSMSGSGRGSISSNLNFSPSC